MDFLIGHYYKIAFDIYGKSLFFSCKIISVDNDFIEFIDKFGKRLLYRKSNIISCEEVDSIDN